MGYNITFTEGKYCTVKFFSYFNKQAAGVVKYWNLEAIFDNTQAKEVLGIDFRPPK